MKGRAASPGKVLGRAFKPLLPTSGGMKDGDVLVVKKTSPKWMPLIEKASAIVTESGGVLSHAAIVSREFGIPCVVGVGDISEIEEGEEIEVDGGKGEVKRYA